MIGIATRQQAAAQVIGDSTQGSTRGAATASRATLLVFATLVILSVAMAVTIAVARLPIDGTGTYPDAPQALPQPMPQPSAGAGLDR